MRLAPTLLALLLLPALAAAAEEPLAITADSLVIEQGGAVIRFEGKVTVKRGDLSLACARLVLRTADGDPARVRTGEGEGGVVLTRAGDRAESERITFDLEAGRAVFIGTPRLFRGKDIVRSTEIVYLLNDGKATFRGPVEALFSTVPAPARGATVAR